MKLQDRVAIVTGASRGIGKAIATEFAKEGAKVVIDFKDSESESEAMNLERELKELGYEVSIFKADISKEIEVKSLIDFTVKQYGAIDILVNNAGIVFDKEWTDKTVEEWNNTISTNLIAAFLTSKYATEYLKKSNFGRIINISSTNATKAYNSYSMDYDVSKAGLVSLTNNLASALAPNVLVNAILPGWVNTDMNKDLPEDFMQKETEKIFVKRIAEPIDIAKVVSFLASDDAGYINGSGIVVDGGYQ